jgi:hypothetical protein
LLLHPTRQVHGGQHIRHPRVPRHPCRERHLLGFLRFGRGPALFASTLIRATEWCVDAQKSSAANQRGSVVPQSVEAFLQWVRPRSDSASAVA